MKLKMMMSLMSGNSRRLVDRFDVRLTGVGTRESSAQAARVSIDRSCQRSRTITGGSSSLDENAKLNNCFFEKKDWRACKNEVRNMSND